MKRLAAALLGIMWLAGCESSGPVVEKLDQVPWKVEKLMEDEHSLQMIETGSGSYLVFRSYMSVRSGFETKGSTLIVNLDEVSPQSDQIETHVYKVETGEEPDATEFRVNGEPAPLGVLIYD